MSKNLDHAYDEYLKSHHGEVLKSIPEFSKNLEKTSFKYGRITIPSFFKPFIVSVSQAQLIKRVAKVFSQLLNSATRLYFEDSHVSHIFHMKPELTDLINIDPGYSESVVFSRFDAILEGDSFKLVDLNCDSPAGAAYGDEVQKVFLSDQLAREFVEEYQIQAPERCEAVLEALLEIYEEFGGYETPAIAIVDWKNVRTRPEFDTLKRCFEEKGYKTYIADPRDFVYKGGKLYYKKTHVRLILRRVAVDELVERLDDVQDFIQAYRDKAVCVVNPLRSRLASSKAILSVLTNPEYDHYFTQTENEAKNAFIPWTRRLRDAEEFYGKKKMYIIDFLKDEKETLVLKPSSSYGGVDVTLGKETPDKDWNEAIDKALKQDWVIQEYTQIPILTVPVIINNKLDFEYKKYNFNALIAGGKYIGGFARLSNDSVVNVARGGGLIPALTSDWISKR